jgi:hypothetical protein
MNEYPKNRTCREVIVASLLDCSPLSRSSLVADCKNYATTYDVATFAITLLDLLEDGDVVVCNQQYVWEKE